MTENIDIRRIWIKQLYKEYTHILWYHRISLTPCAISIDDFTSRLGEWNSHTRTITLSSHLIQNHSWSDVLEILKHEIAHQYVSEVYESSEHHGDFFAKACAKLGVESWARKASVAMGATLHKNQESINQETEGLFRKTEKLLALAQSANQNEALAAMMKVKALYETYHLQQLREEKQIDYQCVVINHKRKRIETYQSMIGALLVGHFFVKVIYSSLFDQESGDEHKVIEILGSYENSQMAEYVYWFLYNNLKLLWEVYSKDLPGVGQVLRRKRSFYEGVISGFRAKLDDEAKVGKRSFGGQGSATSSDKQLLVLGDKALDAYVRHRHPRLSHRGGGGSYVHGESFREGIRQGRQLNLRKGVTENRGFRGGFLT